MAVKTLMMRKQLESARRSMTELQKREADLLAQVEAAEEIDPALEASVNEVADKLEETKSLIDNLQENLAGIEEDTAAVVAEATGSEVVVVEDDKKPAPMRSAAPVAVRSVSGFQCRSQCFGARSQRDAFYARADVKAFLGRVRSMVGGQRRSVTGAELTIPPVVLDLLRDNLNKYSKLISHVRLRSVKGDARQQIVGDVPEGVWMEMSGVLNELTFAINEIETDGYKVGGVIVIDNYLLKDSDIALGEEIIYMLGQSIGYALDKAIVYGTGTKMPIGIVTRLAETSQPSYWTDKRAAWTDLHSTNVLKLNIGSATGESFFNPLLLALGKADPKYSASGVPVWIMNEATRVELMVKAMAFNSAAALVSGLDHAMPVLGGEIITLPFMPDHEIVGGFLDVFLLAEREGGSFAYSDLVKFIEDKTCFKGVARYDGQPVVGEAFVAVNFNNTDVTTSKSFAPDYANTKMNTLIVTAAAGTASGDTVVTVSGAKADSPTLKYCKQATTGGIKVGDKVGSDFKALTSGTTQITAAAGTPIAVVELDSNSCVVSAGDVVAVPKA